MLKNFLIVLFLLFTQTIFSQARFQKGYYITNDGTKISCELEMRKWSTWNNNFLTIKENKEIKKISIAEISEFGIDNTIKFITSVAQLDSSYNDMKKLDFDREPTFETKRILLKVIVEGEYSLYQYLHNNIRKYFYQSKNAPLTQLIYKRYFYNSPAKVNINNDYLNQLKAINTCQNTSPLVNYEYESMKSFFIKLNDCTQNEILFAEGNNLRATVGFGIFAGVNIATFKVKRLAIQEFANISGTSPSIGFEVNYTIPQVTNAIRLNFSAAYSAYDVKEGVVFPPFNSPSDVNITYADILMGGEAKYLFYIAQEQHINFGVGLYTPILLEDYTYSQTDLGISLADNKGIKVVAGFMAGYTYNKLGISVYYSSGSGNLFEGRSSFEVNLQRKFSFRIGYQIL